MAESNYFVIRTSNETLHGKSIYYGLGFNYLGKIMAIYDLTEDLPRMDRLVDVLNQDHTSPKFVLDVIEDFITNIYKS